MRELNEILHHISERQIVGVNDEDDPAETSFSSPPVIVGGQMNDQIPVSQDQQAPVWTHDAVRRLIEICGHMKIDSLQSIRGTAKWRRVADILRNDNFDFHPDRVKMKWFHEKTAYRRYLDNKRKTGARRIDYKFAEEMAAALEDDVSLLPTVLGTASGLIFQSDEVSNPQRKRKVNENESEGQSCRDKKEAKVARDHQQQLIDTMNTHHEEMIAVQTRIANALENLCDILRAKSDTAS